MRHLSPLAANRFAEDPFLYATPNCHVQKGYSNTDGVKSALSANRFAAKQFICAATQTEPARAAVRPPINRNRLIFVLCVARSWQEVREALRGTDSYHGCVWTKTLKPNAAA